MSVRSGPPGPPCPVCGTPVTAPRLAEIERAEAALRALGVAGDLRVRHHGDLARVELARHELGRWLEPARAGAVRAAVADAGFARVAIDLRGFRSGSLNVLEGVVGA